MKNRPAHFALSILALALAGCGVSVWLGHRPPETEYVWVAPDGGAYAAWPEPLGTETAPEPATTTRPIHKFGNIYDGGFVSGNGTFFLTTGTNGTVTVPAGSYVTLITATAGGSGGTITITPAGPSITDAQASPPITLAANQPFALGKPVLQGNPNELGVGSTIVFSSGIANYAIALFEYGGP